MPGYSRTASRRRGLTKNRNRCEGKLFWIGFLDYWWGIAGWLSKIIRKSGQNQLSHSRFSILGQRSGYIAVISLLLAPVDVWAEDYSARVLSVKTELIESVYVLNAAMEFGLSPLAKQAIQKGIALTWRVKIKLKIKGMVWDHQVKQLEMAYQIQNHDLLNSYVIKNLYTDEQTMFSTLTAALKSISRIRQLPLIEKQQVKNNEQYYIAIKILFDREALPVPLRPISYFKSEWALSSPWTLWPLKK